MTKFFSILALAAAVTAPTFAQANSGAVLSDADQVHAQQGGGTAERENYPYGVRQTPDVSLGTIVTTWDHDPFNPYPNATPISRTRFPVFVTDEMTECSVQWFTVPCHVVRIPDLVPFGMVIDNYTHTGPRQVRIERIEYPAHIAVTDGTPVHYVAVED